MLRTKNVSRAGKSSAGNRARCVFRKAPGASAVPGRGHPPERKAINTSPGNLHTSTGVQSQISARCVITYYKVWFRSLPSFQPPFANCSINAAVRDAWSVEEHHAFPVILVFCGVRAFSDARMHCTPSQTSDHTSLSRNRNVRHKVLVSHPQNPTQVPNSSIPFIYRLAKFPLTSRNKYGLDWSRCCFGQVWSCLTIHSHALGGPVGLA